MWLQLAPKSSSPHRKLPPHNESRSIALEFVTRANGEVGTKNIGIQHEWNFLLI